MTSSSMCYDNSCITTIIIIIITTTIIIIIPAHVIPKLLQSQKCVLGSRTNQKHRKFPLPYPDTHPPGDAHQGYCAFDIQEDTKWLKEELR